MSVAIHPVDRESAEAGRGRSAGGTAAAPTPDPAPQRVGGPWGLHGVLRLGGSTGLLLAVFGFLIGSRAISDNSFMTHLANGRLFWSGAGIPRVDPYSFTAAGQPVTVQSWLASIVYGGLVEFAGEWSLRFFNGLLCLLLTAALWVLTGPARQLFTRVALTGAAVILGTLLWSPRPLLFGLLGVAALLLVIERRLPLWSLLPIMWVWVNTHGSFPIALVLVGAVLFGRLLDDHRTWRSIPRSYEARVLVFTAVGVLLGGLNPLGPRLLWFPIHLLGRREALENVIEWKAPTFSSPAEVGFLALIGALLVAARMGARWRSIVPGFLFLVAGLLAVRNLALASLVLAWAAAPALSNLRFLSIDGSVGGLLPRAMAAVGLSVLGVGSVMAVQQGPLDLREYPQDEVTWLQGRDLVADDGVRLLTRETDGNYLEMRFGAQANVFVDDRFDFYPQDVLDDLDTLVFGGDYEDVLDRHRIDVVLWEDEGSFALWLQDSDRWFLAHRTPDDGTKEAKTWIVACRVDSSVAAACRR